MLGYAVFDHFLRRGSDCFLVGAIDSQHRTARVRGVAGQKCGIIGTFMVVAGRPWTNVVKDVNAICAGKVSLLQMRGPISDFGVVPEHVQWSVRLIARVALRKGATTATRRVAMIAPVNGAIVRATGGCGNLCRCLAVSVRRAGGL